MTIRAVVFDIGGVLEYTPNLGVIERWEKTFGLQPGDMNEKLGQVWGDGAIGQISEEEVHQQISQTLGFSQAQVSAFMEDIWIEYLGTLNVELVNYFRTLRPRYQTAIISNSFVGAREREQDRYHFDEMCDFILYSHEVGFAKPDRQIFELAWLRMGIQPSEMIFLDDFEPNVNAARDLGIHALLFQDIQQAIAAIQTLLQ